ncbi:hypothetical protein A7D21_30505 [Pseudomonas sp. AP19]|uniref:hypothetical protein n=1 Tax=Pseudomonas TaxID=286 RepID=UPI00084B1D94|nr:hypothetical protein [Pseudomonas sp. AP19]OEC70120.1 hypothetical protein A7D21_30505 [Pseudomonas sp. AP19]
MTILSIRKANKDELQSLIDFELTQYKSRVAKHDVDDAKINRDIDNGIDIAAKGYTTPRKLFLGALEEIVGTTLQLALNAAQARIDAGAKLYTGGSDIARTFGLGAVLYIVKPESEQAEDIKTITKEVNEQYTADIDAHNEKVFAQEAEALKAEEAAIAAQLRAEDEQRAQADFDKRVRARMKGAK